jgi:hypothetical protein
MQFDQSRTAGVEVLRGGDGVAWMAVLCVVAAEDLDLWSRRDVAIRWLFTA